MVTSAWKSSKMFPPNNKRWTVPMTQFPDKSHLDVQESSQLHRIVQNLDILSITIKPVTLSYKTARLHLIIFTQEFHSLQWISLSD